MKDKNFNFNKFDSAIVYLKIGDSLIKTAKYFDLVSLFDFVHQFDYDNCIVRLYYRNHHYIDFEYKELQKYQFYKGRVYDISEINQFNFHF